MYFVTRNITFSAVMHDFAAKPMDCFDFFKLELRTINMGRRTFLVSRSECKKDIKWILHHPGAFCQKLSQAEMELSICSLAIK